MSRVEEIESHDDHDHDEMVHEMIVLYPDNTTSMLEVEMMQPSIRKVPQDGT